MHSSSVQGKMCHIESSSFLEICGSTGSSEHLKMILPCSPVGFTALPKSRVKRVWSRVMFTSIAKASAWILPWPIWIHSDLGDDLSWNIPTSSKHDWWVWLVWYSKLVHYIRKKALELRNLHEFAQSWSSFRCQPVSCSTIRMLSTVWFVNLQTWNQTLWSRVDTEKCIT